jgi:hypothetical protein
MENLGPVFQLILDILGVGGIITSIVLVIDKIRFRKQEKKTKESEAMAAEEDAEQKKIENDRAHLELTQMYKNKVVELEDERAKLFIPIRDSILEMKHDIKESKQDIKETKQDTKVTMNEVSELKEKYGLMEGYLNGEYQNYLKMKKKKRPMPKRRVGRTKVKNEKKPSND